MRLQLTDYCREAVVAYAEKWALSRNPAYYNFSGIGGDCTNFASQCIYAGCGVMNPAPVTGWYYYGVNARAASWTGVEHLFRFLMSNTGAGPYASVVGRTEICPGDILQLGRGDGTFYHTPVILSADAQEIYVAAHSFDALRRPLSSYVYDQIRYIRIDGARSR
jgi:hypothetical protein